MEQSARSYQVARVDRRCGRRRELVLAVKRVQDEAPGACEPSLPVMVATVAVRPPGLRGSLATSRSHASTDQCAGRLDSVQGTAATELGAPCLLAPGHLSVSIGCRAYACAGRRTSRYQCAEDYCRKQPAFCFHHGIPFFVKNAIGNSGLRSVPDHSDCHELSSSRLRSARRGLNSDGARAPPMRHVAKSRGRGDAPIAPRERRTLPPRHPRSIRPNLQGVRSSVSRSAIRRSAKPCTLGSPGIQIHWRHS